MPHRLDAGSPGFEAAFEALLAAKRAVEEDVGQAVAAILAEVRARGDAALIDYTERFDRVRLGPKDLRVPAAELRGAAARCPAETLAALKFAARRIADHHRRQIPADLDYRDAAGL
ncbi:MAG: histidinol dehydrogenase, partial [Kiloniellaceae bacterium]